MSTGEVFLDEISNQGLDRPLEIDALHLGATQPTYRDYPCARVFAKAMFERWALEPAALSPTSRRHRMLRVAKFCRYLARMRPTTFVPNPRTLPKQLPHQAPYLLSEHEVVRLLAGTPMPRVTINIRLALNFWWRYERKRGPV